MIKHLIIEKMFNSKIRTGSFTSSKIGALMSDGKAKGTYGKPFYTYVEETNMERRLGRSLNVDFTSRNTSWGVLVESVAFNLLPDDEGYVLTSQETLQHKTIKGWCGSPDGLKSTNTVFDIKSCATLKSFCQFADCKSIDEIREKHPDGEKYYWQLISNAILTDCEYAELIIFVPFQEELDMIRDFAENFEGDQNKVAWVAWAQDKDIPYLIKGKHYKNLNIFRWKISEEDKIALTNRVIEAGKLLIAIEEEKKVYAPTPEQIAEAQDKIRFMEELRKRMKTKSI